VEQKCRTGNVKKLLIENGLLLLNKVGYNDFSIRKVAAMSGVSHGAPYKHFKNKEELIAAIGIQVEGDFKDSLKEAVFKYMEQPQTQLIEMGKKYVQFMVENPEYLKFLFLGPREQNIKLAEGQLIYNKSSAFSVFKDTASNYLHSVGKDPTTCAADILTMWSMVHGIAILIAEQNLEIEGNYLDVVSNMLCYAVKLMH
jgi:AcrR family transcriptional regulator